MFLKKYKQLQNKTRDACKVRSSLPTFGRNAQKMECGFYQKKEC